MIILRKLLIGLGLLCFAGCSRDMICSNQCQHNGYCDFGQCHCLTGYEGSNCTSALRKFIGIYTGTVIINDSLNLSQTDSLTISSDSTYIYVNSNNNTYFPSIGFIIDTGSLYIKTPVADFIDSAGIPNRRVVGTGYLSSNLTILKLSYSIQNSSSSTTYITYSFTGTRQ